MFRKKILWLASWYPNDTAPFDGDFIQRHAKAAAIYDDIHVLYVTKNSATENFQTLNQYTGLTEQLFYFKEATIYKSIKNQILYLKFFKKGITDYINKNGLPHLVHVHVPWKAGLIALWIKNKYGIPFFITEHWGIYNKVEKNNFTKWPMINKKLLGYTYKKSQKLLTGSHYLGESINNMVTKKPYFIMPNVVDTTLFHFNEKQENEPFTFIHVSNGALIKNIEGIIKAFAMYLNNNNLPNDRLIIVGTESKLYKVLPEMDALWNKHIFFKGEVPYTEVATQMKSAQVLLLFSHMENSPCVIGESLCCGVPVVATKVGGIPELINESSGVLVSPGDVPALAIAMHSIKMNYKNYNRKLISHSAVEKYNYGTIAKQFHLLYHEA